MASMDLHEFELRYLAYKGLSTRLNLDWDESMIINLTKITNKGVLEKSVPETSPADLRRFTHETYTPFKNKFIEDNKEFFPVKTSQYSLSDYIERLEYELKVVKSMGFNTYFLIVSDYVRWAKRQMIVVGPGRGSGAGSLLARTIEITDIDPLPFDLLFERFLNPARISMPDFDIDFEDTEREKVIQYCSQKYGKEKVCSIGTFMKMASKAAFKDSARAIGVPFDRANTISNLIPEKVSLKQLVTEEVEETAELRGYYNGDDKVKQAFDLAAGLEGNIRQLGVHACGIIIAPEAVSTYTPSQYVKEDDHTIVSQYDGPTLEGIGLLKMDFLGLRNLSIIKNCIRNIEQRYKSKGEELPDIYKHFLKTTSFQPDITDKKAYDIFKNGDTTGIFQFESQGMRKFLIQLEPEAIHDLVAMNALYRPGPMEFIPRYIERKHGREPIEYMSEELRTELTKKYGADVAEEENKKLIEDLSPIMGLTYGIAIYQEQLMFLVQAMAGFSLGEADMLRRGVGKKKKEVIEKLKKEFIERGASFRQYKPETTTNIYEKMIEPAASYSFNKSHSVCYAMVAYQTAYLKTYFPIEFYAALIRSVEEDTDTQSFYISEIQNKGISILRPDINYSFSHVSVAENGIRLGFFSVKGIGADVGEFIANEREKNGKYSSLEDFLKRCAPVINKKSLEGIIKSGGLDDFGDRNILLSNMENLINWTKNISTADLGLFGGLGVDMKVVLKKCDEASHIEKLLMEQEVLKSFITGNPLDGLYQYIKKFSFLNQVIEQQQLPKFIIHGYIKEVQRAKKKGFFVKIEDISGNWEFFVKEAPDLQKFDLIILYGSKNNGRIYIDKLIKTDYETLKSLAGSRYDPDWTVERAKHERYGINQEHEIEQIKAALLEEAKKNGSSNQNIEKSIEDNNSDEDSNDSEQIDDTTLEDKDSDEVFGEDISLESSTSEEKVFSINGLPDSIEKINTLTDVLKNYPGDITIVVMGNEKKVNAAGLQRLKKVFGN